MYKRIFALFILFMASVFVSAYFMFKPNVPSHPTLASAKLPPIIPLREFYANKDAKYGFSVSRDGSKLAWIEIKWFKPVLMIKDLETGKVEQVETPKSSIWRYYWASDNNSILLNIDRSGQEKYELAIRHLNKKSSKWRYFDLGKNASSFIQQIPKTNSNKILIANNRSNAGIFNLYYLDLSTGGTTEVGVHLDQQINHTFDDNGEIIGRVNFGEIGSGNWKFESGDPDAGWKEIASGDYTDTLRMFGPKLSDGTIHAISNRDRDKMAIVKLDLSNGEETIIYGHDTVDVGFVDYNSEANELLKVRSFPDSVDSFYFSKKFEKLEKLLPVSDNESVSLSSHSLDYSKLIFSINNPAYGSKSYFVDASKNKVDLLFSTTIEKYADRLSIDEPVFIKARDGLEIPAFLSRPKGVEGPVPLVLVVHGGPISRTYGGYENFYALLNNRGYAVLDVNYRGSWGYGRKFAELAKGEIAGKMSSDIIDARNWAVELGIADPDAVAIFGVSWGGFEVMTALTQNSDLFAAGININGVADLSTMLKEVPDYWRGWQEWLIEYGADPSTQEGLDYLKDRSPLYNADKIKTPLLIYQGGNDVRVVKSQSERMVKALREHNAPVEYVFIPKVGHDPSGWPWQQRYLMIRKIEHFLANHLGGRTGGFDYAILGAHLLP